MKRRDFIASSAALMGLSAQAQVVDLNDAINKAGRQRMLSQRISKAYLALAHKVEAESARQVLDRSLALFDRQLAELKHFAPGPDIRETYVKLEALWSDFKDVVVGSAPAKEHAAKVLQLDGAILALANQGTQQYERASARSLGKLVNIAGRQRMLSQRMAKFYLASAMKVDPQGSVAEIGKARAEFVAALETLRSAPESTPRIKEELALADAQWIFFNQGMQHPDAAHHTPKVMSDVFVTSENLLSVMDRVTGLYSGIKVGGVA
jgi:nitrate/nitrite-specific signal transduction histidine kinase